MYLNGHLNPAGGAALILKYTGRSPVQGPTAVFSTTATSTFRPSTPSSLGVHLRQRTLGAKSPLTAPAKFLQSPGGLEALIQGAAKNVIERGEKLGVNQAVRDAVGEIRRNVQILQEARTPGVGSPLAREDADKSFAVALLERRDRQLAKMLDETMTSLKDLSNALKDGIEKEKCIEGIEMAAAKIQFVKVHLEDSSLSLPEEEMPALQNLSLSAPSITREPIVALDTTPVVLTSTAVEEARSTLSSPGNMVQDTDRDASSQHVSPPLPTVQEIQLPPADDQMETDISPSPPPQPPSQPETQPVTEIRPDRLTAPQPKRPAAIPTRSTLAQSSFSWMLEPDTTAMPASPPLPPKEKYEQGGQGHKKRPSSGRRNNKNAFLFGEVVPSDEEGEGRLGDGNVIFGLRNMGN
jgi:TBC1 domain family protein 5